MSSALYDRLGGDAAIMAAVELLYEKLLADPLTRPFFEGLDMAALTRKQVAFLSWAFGGPEALRGRDLREAHAPLVRDRGLDDRHFDAVCGHLEAALGELGIEPELVTEVRAVVAALRAEVLGR